MYKNTCVYENNNIQDQFLHERILLDKLHSELNVPPEKRFTWEELYIENPFLSNQIHDYVNMKKEQDRKQSYQIIGNDYRLRSYLSYTKLCNSVKNNTICPHGNNCRFAHSIDELQISTCAFGNNCKFIYYNGIYHNRCSKICNHIHPFETFENFKARCDM
jgi:hypothetical protein